MLLDLYYQSICWNTQTTHPWIKSNRCVKYLLWNVALQSLFKLSWFKLIGSSFCTCVSVLVYTTMLPAASPALRCQATVELQLGVATSFAQEASPLPCPAFLWRGDVPELAAPEKEDQDSKEKCVNKTPWVSISFAMPCFILGSLIKIKVEVWYK